MTRRPERASSDAPDEHPRPGGCRPERLGRRPAPGLTSDAARRPDGDAARHRRVPGVAIGAAVVMGGHRTNYPRRRVGSSEIKADSLERFEAAVERAQDELRDMAKRIGDHRAEASILEGSPADARRRGARRRREAPGHRGAPLRRVGGGDRVRGDRGPLRRARRDLYLRERSHDVMFVGERLLRAFSLPPQESPSSRATPRPLHAQPDRAAELDRQRPATFGAALPRFSGPMILIAHDLSPADTAASMVDEPVVGFVTYVGTRTSHTSIMARALEIPAVVGVSRRAAARDPHGRRRSSSTGSRGTVVVRTRPSRRSADARDALRAATSRSAQRCSRRARQAVRHQPTDVRRSPLKANVELPAEAILARRPRRAGHRPLPDRVPLHRPHGLAPRGPSSSRSTAPIVEALAPAAGDAAHVRHRRRQVRLARSRCRPR